MPAKILSESGITLLFLAAYIADWAYFLHFTWKRNDPIGVVILSLVLVFSTGALLLETAREVPRGSLLHRGEICLGTVTAQWQSEGKARRSSIDYTFRTAAGEIKSSSGIDRTFSFYQGMAVLLSTSLLTHRKMSLIAVLPGVSDPATVAYWKHRARQFQRDFHSFIYSALINKSLLNSKLLGSSGGRRDISC
jgi:hypothetical protein